MTPSSCSRRVRVERGIYRQPNGKYAVCFRHARKLRFRTIGFDLPAARRQREALIAAAQSGEAPPLSPQLRFHALVASWVERFRARVAAGERRQRTLEAHLYHIDRQLLPAFAARRASSITVDDIVMLLAEMRSSGCSPKTCANALGTLQAIMRYARRNGWITTDPVDQLEFDERPRPERRRQRVLGRQEIERLFGACSPRDRLMVATALYTGTRISELLGLVWGDLDLAGGVLYVRAQLSRAHRGVPVRRVAPKTPASVRQIPLVVQLARMLAHHKLETPNAQDCDWVFATLSGTPHGQRNVGRRSLGDAADRAGLNSEEWPPLRFHDLRHTFASHLIVDLGLDVAQVSRILGHASITITLDVYTHLFDNARHSRELRTRMGASPFAGLLAAPTKPVTRVNHLAQSVEVSSTDALAPMPSGVGNP